MSRFLNEYFQKLSVYTPGEQPKDAQYIKLNTNESPYPPHPAVIEAVMAEAGRLQLYSDPECAALRDAIASLHGLKRGNVYVASGSDDVLNFAFMAYSGETLTASFPDITYGFYQVFCGLHGITAHTVPLRGDFSINVRDFDDCHGLIALANPNAPTGLSLSVDQIEALLKAHQNDVVLIDEAYVDFGAQSCVPLIDRYDNLLVVQTFSKSRGLAGARLGFALANEALIEDLTRLKYSTNPYNVNRMTLAAGQAAILHNEWYMRNCRAVAQTRDSAIARLRDMGFECTDSLANFIFAQSGKISGAALYARLKEKGILVRHFTGGRIDNHNRITVGTPEQMDALITATQEILEEK